MRPVTQAVSAAYKIKGSWAAGYHTGIDYRSPTGTPCRAAVGGKVIYAGNGGGWGAAYGVQIITEATIGGTKYRLLYAHLKSVSVKAGQTVSIGQVIGHTGNTGRSTGPHLHFEVRRSPYTYGKSDVNPSIAVNVQAAAKKSNVALARDELSKALAHLDAAIKNGRGAPVKNARAQIAKALATLPKS